MNQPMSPEQQQYVQLFQKLHAEFSARLHEFASGVAQEGDPQQRQTREVVMATVCMQFGVASLSRFSQEKGVPRDAVVDQIHRTVDQTLGNGG